MTGPTDATAGRTYITARADGLYIDEVRATAIAERHGTPVSVIALNQVRANLDRWRTALASSWPAGPTAVFASFKANTSLALWRHLDAVGAGCDVCGEHELRAALEIGIDPERISLNGPTKSATTLDLAVRTGVKIVVDSLDELLRTAAIASRHSRQVQVRLRLRPWLDDTVVASDFSPATPAHLAIHDYRAGIPAADIAQCVALVDQDPNLGLTGIHAHISRQTTHLPFWSAFGRWMADAADSVITASSRSAISEVSFGGGYAIPADPTGQATERRSTPAPAPELYLQAMLGAFAGRLRELRLPVEGLRVEIEPGRAIFGDAGVHLTNVLHVKRQSEPVQRTFVEVDTSEVFLADVVWEASRFDVVVANEPSRPASGTVAITGVSCGFDVLRGPEPTPTVQPGDTLAFFDTGAYQDPTASNFNLLGRPPLVLIDGDTCQLVRARESYNDVVRREIDGIIERLP